MMVFRFISRLKTKRKPNIKFLTSLRTTEGNSRKIKSWQVHSYGGLEELQLTDSRIPVIKNPEDIVVRVHASSVNPIDLAMLSGYGSVLLNFMRQTKNCVFEDDVEFPLTLGRDFAGVIVDKGHGVSEELSIGDEVWGVVPVQDQGCHAQEVLISKKCVKKKPKNLSMIEAGSILYAAVTAWSALKITGGLALFPITGKSVLVLGGSGGVGTMAIQMLSLWGAHIVATCSADAVPLLESLGAHNVIDYKEEGAFEKINEYRYDVILDCTGGSQENASMYVNFLKDYKFAKYITLRSPMVKNFDEYGMIAGGMKNAADLLSINIASGVLAKTSSIRWGFFFPLETALCEITNDVSNSKIVPQIHKTFDFFELPEAYKFVKEGHLRGKVVINMTSKR